MLTILTGSHREAILKEAGKRLESFRKKGDEVVRFDDSNFSREAVASYIDAADLFGKNFAVLLDKTFAHAEGQAFAEDSLENLSASANAFILCEEKLTAAFLKEAEKRGVEVVRMEASTAKKIEFNTFALADALGERRKKDLWVLYRQALRFGKSAEEINGVLFWQLKSMILIAKGAGVSVSPYVRSKASRFLKNYSKEELEKLSLSIVEEYHLSRRGGLSLEERVEKMILSL